LEEAICSAAISHAWNGDNMDISFDFNLSQNQTISLNTVHFMSLLQMNTAELSKYINNLLLENPVLESDCPSVSYFDSAGSHVCRNVAENNDTGDSVALLGSCEDHVTLFDDVCRQICEKKTALEPIALRIAACLDGNGFVSEGDLNRISRVFGEKETIAALDFVQSLSPSGLAARSVSERLLLQMKDHDVSPLALEIVKKHVEALSKHRYSYISKLTGASLNEVLEAVSEILALEPFPFAEFDAKSKTQYVIPDITLDEYGDLSIADEYIPKLSVSAYYKRMLSDCDDPVVKEYLAEKLKSASWLINNLVRRKRTIINCAHAIISRQSEFFESKGTAPLSPLTQRELAESLNVNASTICRIVNSKYIQCPFGTYPLSHFFCTAVRTDNGSVSASHIKQRIEAIVKAEAAADPLSDQRITELLSKENIKVSRRTVAKYRLEMDIPDRAERRNRYKLTAT
jgi:RNA polymerase sigma-54 factor